MVKNVILTAINFKGIELMKQRQIKEMEEKLAKLKAE